MENRKEEEKQKQKAKAKLRYLVDGQKMRGYSSGIHRTALFRLATLTLSLNIKGGAVLLALVSSSPGHHTPDT